jgi:hypothetical protein
MEIRPTNGKEAKPQALIKFGTAAPRFFFQNFITSLTAIGGITA